MNSLIANRIRSIDLVKALEILMLLSLLVVWIVWPLRGTIAARNIALVFGAIFSMGWLYLAKPKFKILDLVPIVLLLCVPAWLLGLYIFNPVVPHLQWDDLRGTWLRVIVGIIFAIGLGWLFNERPRYRCYFLYVLIIWPIVLFGAFLNEILFAHTNPEYFIAIFKSKIACVYFLMWSILFLFSFMHFVLLTGGYRKSKKKYILGTFCALGICLVDLFALQSLNGFLILLYMSLLFLAILLKTKQMDVSFRGVIYQCISLSVLIGIFLMLVWHFDAQYSHGKLHNFYADIQFILNHDTSGLWKWDGSSVNLEPINSLTNKPVNGSTYQRITWFIQGIDFIKSHPFGLGYTSRAFMNYMAEQFPGSSATKTHSGWLDFALGAGVVCLLCVWTAIGSIIVRAWHHISKDKPFQIISFFAFWALSTMFWLWLIGELSEREFIEHFFFVITFFSIAITQKSSASDVIFLK